MTTNGGGLIQALDFQQPSDGFRFGIDSVILGAGVGGFNAEARILDAGCGVGVVGLLAARTLEQSHVTMVDVQEETLKLAYLNVKHNKLEDRCSLYEGDLRKLCGEPPIQATCDLVLLNPPYFKQGSGQLNPNKSKAAARHELHGNLQALLAACKRAMAKRATLRLIYPAQWLPRVLSSIWGAGLRASKIRPIYSRAHEEAVFILVDARAHGRREASVAAPITLFEDDGTYTPLVQSLLAGEHVAI